MKSDFDQAADSKLQRESERALQERSQSDIDTARQSLIRMQQVHRQNIDSYARLKVFFGILLAAATVIGVICSRQ